MCQKPYSTDKKLSSNLCFKEKNTMDYKGWNREEFWEPYTMTTDKYKNVYRGNCGVLPKQPSGLWYTPTTLSLVLVKKNC